MLKVKDNVSLKTLEKYGFEPDRDHDTFDLNIGIEYMVIWSNRQICLGVEYDSFVEDGILNVLYQMIVDGILEIKESK